jgi:uncharacterized membrane protein YfcA
MMHDASLLGFSIAGLVVGVIVGLTGVGGGSLMTPILTLVFGIPANIAVGTDLAFAAATKGVGTAVHGLRGTVRWWAVRWLLAGSLPAALLALWGLHVWGTDHADFNKMIAKVIGGCVLLTVMSLLFRAKILLWLKAHPQYVLQRRTRGWVLLAGGAAIGALVTVSSIGAGAVGATFLLMVNPEWEPAEVAGTDIAYAVPLTLVAGLGHAALGTVNWALLSGLLLGSVPGIAFGSYIAKSLPERWVRSVLIGVLTLTGLRLIW